MKKLVLALAILGTVVSCKPTLYMGNYGQVNQTQVVLSKANFKVLGSFSGVVSEKSSKLNIKNQTGMIAAAKAQLLANAKAAGVELNGSRTLVNVSVDVVQNTQRVTVTVSGEIIEFVE